MRLNPYLGPMSLMAASTIKVSSNAASTSMVTSTAPAQTRSQKPAYSGGSGVAASDSAFGLDGVAIGGTFSRNGLSTSPQNKQNLPSGKAGLPQLTQTCWTATAIGGEYYRRRKPK